MVGVPFPDTPNTPIGFQSHGGSPWFCRMLCSLPWGKHTQRCGKHMGKPWQNDQRWIFHIEL